MAPSEPSTYTQTDTPPNLTKDQTYFFDDGDCIIQAGSYLFKVHQFLLKSDSQILRNLFSLPRPPASPYQDNAATDLTLEGESEEHPLVFQDSADDFQALCWALYAKPSDIREQQYPEKVDLIRITKVLAIAHKYEIEHLWDWSLQIIKDHLNLIPNRLISSIDGSWVAVGRLLNLSNISPDVAFIGQHIEQEWLQMIQSSNLDEALAAFMAALDVAERSPGLRRFQGKAYHAYARAMGKPRASSAVESAVELGNLAPFIGSLTSKLGESRTSRLCQGFWSLSQLRLELSVAPQIKEGPGCTDHSGQCVPAWRGWWAQNAPNQTTQEPRDFIVNMWSRARSSGMSYYLSRYGNIRPHCYTEIMKLLNEMADEYDDTLADLFMVPRG